MANGVSGVQRLSPFPRASKRQNAMRYYKNMPLAASSPGIKASFDKDPGRPIGFLLHAASRARCTRALLKFKAKSIGQPPDCLEVGYGKEIRSQQSEREASRTGPGGSQNRLRRSCSIGRAWLLQHACHTPPRQARLQLGKCSLLYLGWLRQLACTS